MTALFMRYYTAGKTYTQKTPKFWVIIISKPARYNTQKTITKLYEEMLQKHMAIFYRCFIGLVCVH